MIMEILCRRAVQASNGMFCNLLVVYSSVDSKLFIKIGIKGCFNSYIVALQLSPKNHKFCI